MKRVGLEDRRGQGTEIMEFKVALLAGESSAGSIFLAPHASEGIRKVHLHHLVLRVVRIHDPNRINKVRGLRERVFINFTLLLRVLVF